MNLIVDEIKPNGLNRQSVMTTGSPYPQRAVHFHNGLSVSTTGCPFPQRVDRFHNGSIRSVNGLNYSTDYFELFRYDDGTFSKLSVVATEISNSAVTL